MKTRVLEEEIKYTGLELAPHWIYRNFKIQGDAIVAFIGECEVNLSEMVDVEEIVNGQTTTKKVQKKILHIDIIHKSIEDMMNQYNFKNGK